MRFSFRWDLGHSRFLMIDSRNGRLLEDGLHLMVGDAEFDWIEQQVAAPGRVDHLVLGTSVPWLLPHAIGDLETVNEIAAGRPGWRGRLGEKIRQGADLEHWSAFRESFDRLTAMIERAAASGPATVSVLSGDVHHSYAARAELPSRPAAPGAPADLLAGAQQDGVVHPARLPAQLVARDAGLRRGLGRPGRGAPEAAELGADLRAVLREHDRHPGHRRTPAPR